MQVQLYVQLVYCTPTRKRQTESVRTVSTVGICKATTSELLRPCNGKTAEKPRIPPQTAVSAEFHRQWKDQCPDTLVRKSLLLPNLACCYYKQMPFAIQTQMPFPVNLRFFHNWNNLVVPKYWNHPYRLWGLSSPHLIHSIELCIDHAAFSCLMCTLQLQLPTYQPKWGHTHTHTYIYIIHPASFHWLPFYSTTSLSGWHVSNISTMQRSGDSLACPPGVQTQRS